MLGTEVVNLAEVWMGDLGDYRGEEVTIVILSPPPFTAEAMEGQKRK